MAKSATRRGAIAVFVKTPGLSPVKTRLAATIGREQAEHFFHLAQKAVAAVLKQAQAVFTRENIELSAYWAVGEAEGLADPLWQSPTVQRIHTGEGGLGERMHHVYTTLLASHDFVLLLGVDSPQNTAKNLLRAAHYLNEPQTVVFGAAHDGGFYLLGGNTAIDLPHWSAVTYSADDTLQQFLAQLTGYQIQYLEPLTDVDVQADLQQVCSEMTEPLLPAQQAIRDWVFLLY